MNQRDDRPAVAKSSVDGGCDRVQLPSRALVQGLWCAWAALLAGAIVWGSSAAGHESLPATWGRMGASLALVAAAILGYLDWRGSRPARFMGLIAAGMALGTLGDFFNAGLLNRLVPLPDPVLGGMISFGLGHIAYIWACIEAARVASLRDRRARNIALYAWLLVAVAGWYAIVYLAPREDTRPLVFPALPYSMLLASTAGFATGLAWQKRLFCLMAIGAALFFLSDMLLAIGLFRGSLPYATALVWLTYSPGQMLIVFGALAACPFLVDRAAAAELATLAVGVRK